MIFAAKNLSTRRGFTLTEIAIVMGCVGLLIGAMWAAADKVWDNYRVYRTVQQATAIVQNIRDHYSACQGFDNCATPVSNVAVCITKQLDQLGLFPIEMRRNPSLGPGNSQIDHPFANSLANLGTCAPFGSLEVDSEKCPPPAGNGLKCFRLRFWGLTQQPCVKMLMASPITTGMGFDAIGSEVGGGAVLNLNDTLITQGVTVTLAMAQAWCNQPGNGNQFFWEFKLHN